MSIHRRHLLAGLSAVVPGAGGLPLSSATGSAGIYLRLVKANDALVSGILSGSPAASPGRASVRRTSTRLEALAAAYCAPESAHARSSPVAASIEDAAASLLKAQHGDGTIDSGNLSSPPDTAFVEEQVCTALAVLRKLGDTRLHPACASLERFARAAGEALVTGGVHTPNHRWVICSALARLNHLSPDRRYVARIDDWLDEGIDIDPDGQFSERSTGIYSRVTDAALVVLARLLQRPSLLDPVRRNLDLTLYHCDPEGELETVASRRQDVALRADLSAYYLEYRYLAIRDRNPLYAAATELIERHLAARISNTPPLIHFLDEPTLRQDLPPASELPSDFVRVFSHSGLARIRRGPVTASIFGGSDWPLGVASGLSSNPTFFRFRKGQAVLESVRMGGQFFSLGAFHPESLIVDNEAFSLRQRFEAPYYQPLPKNLRRRGGDYPLTPARDARFWSKLNFPQRPVANVQVLDQRVTVREHAGRFELEIEVSGHNGVPYTLELAFRPGGVFEGDIEERARGQLYLLRHGMGRYRAGGDTIEFGPGLSAHDMLNLSGSSYSAHGSELRPPGVRLCLTALTPFRTTLTVRAL